jgi:hypothetical protein
MSAWILIVMVTIGGPSRIVTQEFGSKQACERASQVVKKTLHNADLACVPKY